MEVSLKNYRENYRAIQGHVEPSRVIAVVKANAYGFGSVVMVRALKEEGANMFAVATPDEAVELREAGIGDFVLVLGSSPYDAAETYVKLDICAALTDIVMAEKLSEAAQRLGRPARVHLKVDSGMGRIGFLPDAAPGVFERVSKLPGLRLEGMFTHFAAADEADLTHTRSQYAAFSSVVAAIKGAGFNPGLVHCCNSAALLADLSEMFFDAVRPGEILAGLNPATECGKAIPFKPCFEVKSAVGVVRELPTGSGISYGLTYTTEEPERLAVIPIGYADGYSRALSNVGEVLIRGKRCPVRGRVCMDQLAVGVSHVEGVKAGDEVVLIGKQKDDAITVEEIAAKLSTITVAIPVMFTARMPRVYV
jgi:alanine racemase